MKFAPVYNITLIIQEKCVKCTRVHKIHNRFCMIFNQLEFDIRTIIDSFSSFFYQTMSLRPMRNNIQHIYYFVSKKQKIYIFTKVFKKYLLYIL